MAKSGVKIPELEGRKDITGFSWILKGFMRIGTSRPVTMGGPLPLPWNVIHEYAVAAKMTETEEYVFVAVVEHLDEVWLDHVHRKLRR